MDRVDLSPSCFLISRETETSTVRPQSGHASIRAGDSRGTGDGRSERPSQEDQECQASDFALRTQVVLRSRQGVGLF